MKESFEAIKKIIKDSSDEDRKALRTYLMKLLPHPLECEWGIDADAILSAINRSSDLTKRGVRGIIAEAVFVNEIAPSVWPSGWTLVDFDGDHSYDALLKKGSLQARVQVKLQRLERGLPKQYYPKHYKEESLFVVEIQKTRTGKKISKLRLAGTEESHSTTEAVTVKTRPYSFGDFDILAVNMHPSSRDWRNFRYTVASWLLPRSSDQKLIEIFQPVAAVPNNFWTDDFASCLKWYESGEEHRILTDLLHLKPSKKSRTSPRKARSKRSEIRMGGG